jgi:hypothetical protein
VVKAAETNAKKRGWKDKLLSSSVPLEFECARIFRKAGFWITPEYCFRRLDENRIDKEFSVDFVARAFAPFDHSGEVHASVEVPVECKFRTRNKRWVFLPEPSDDEDALLAHGIRVLDEFSSFEMEADAIRTFNCNLEVAYKGFEINSDSGDVHDADLKHGVNQLRYLLPHLVASHISEAVSSYPEDNQPLVFSPVLVTTAPLYLLNEDVSIATIEHATSLDELMRAAQFIALRTSDGPDFETHLMKSCENLEDIRSRDWTGLIDRRSKSAKSERAPWGSPAAILAGLSKGTGFTGWFDAFVICRLEALPSYIEQVKQAVEADARKCSFEYPLPNRKKSAS